MVNPDDVFEYEFDPDELGLDWLPPTPAKQRPQQASANARAPVTQPAAQKPIEEPVINTPSVAPQSLTSTVPAGDHSAGQQPIGARQTNQPPVNPLLLSPSPTQQPVSETPQLAPPLTSDPQPPEWNQPSAWMTRISVHALGQFVFCGRSGVSAVEQGDDSDVDEPLPRLDYLPNFDLAQIEEHLSGALRAFGVALLLSLAAPACLFLGLLTHRTMVAYPALALTGLAWLWLADLLWVLLVLLSRRRAARSATPREPRLELDQIEPVNWWSLLKAGFEPVNYQRPFRHPRIPLEGSPWRVLERGSLRIPVIRSGARQLGDAKHRLYPKHELRLGAYALLLEATEHVSVPYGLIFPAHSHSGLAVPITPALRQRVHQQLESAVELVEKSQRGEAEPRSPQDRNRCANCRLGEPVRISEWEVMHQRNAGNRLLVLLQPGTGEKFHCLCGDRFGSAPPHRRTLQLGLSTLIE